MKIYIIRHGQTTGDVENLYGGDYDDHLTDLGIKQATDMASEVKDFGIEIIFASPKIRAQETAKILQKELNVEIKTIDGLRERNQNGILTGMNRDEAKLKYPKMVEELKDYRNTIEGAEDYEKFTERVINAFAEVSNTNYKTVAVVTHGGPIRRILGHILKIEKKHDIEDCAWLEVDYSDGKASIIKTKGVIEKE
jgi:broad specificity phosphatase PhoE